MEGSDREPSEARKEASVTGFELLAGAALPIEVDLRVEITPGDPERASEVLPPGTAEQLVEHENRLLDWLEQSDEHRRAFLTDPVGSLERAKVKLDPEVLDALREQHAQTAGADVLPPGVAIRSLGTRVSRERPCREDSSEPQAEGDGPGPEAEGDSSESPEPATGA
jgi:hypothetical protein